MKIVCISWILFLLFSLSGCGKNNSKEIQTVVQTLPAPEAPLPGEQDDINSLVAEENSYRMAAGQALLSPGLTCTLHNLSATMPSAIPASLPSAVATFVYQGSFNQPDGPASAGLNILPSALKLTYVSWFLVQCSGQIVIIDNDYALFKLTSDDGSKLFLDGTLLVNNDGNHGAIMLQGSKLMRRGVHSFKLQYMQGPAGNQALILENALGVIPGNRFYR